MISIKIGSSIPVGGNIPGRRRPNKSVASVYKGHARPEYKKFSTKKLEELLKYAENLHKELKQIVQLEPDNINLEKLDKLELTINQIKNQIGLRKEN